MTPTNTEALAALSYAEAAKLLANELDYKYQRGIDPHDGEWRNAVTLLHRLSAVEAENGNLSGMAGCMDMLRRDLIQAGVIESSVAPMFMTEAILSALQKANDERDKFASESAQHFIRGREWAERAGQMEAERDALRAALADAAQSLETIARNAGKKLDSEGQENMLAHHDQVRGYANSRAGAARAAMKGTQA